jgi:hypothetical protein
LGELFGLAVVFEIPVTDWLTKNPRLTRQPRISLGPRDQVRAQLTPEAIKQLLTSIRHKQGTTHIEVTTPTQEPSDRELDLLEIRILSVLVPEAIRGPRVAEIVNALGVAAGGDLEQLIAHRLADAGTLPEVQPLIVAAAAHSLWGHSATSERDAREQDPGKKQHVSRALTQAIMEKVSSAKQKLQAQRKGKAK